MIPLTLLAVFLGSFGLVVGTYVFLSRRSLARRVAAKRRAEETKLVGATGRLLREDLTSDIPLLNQWLKKSAHAVSLRHDLRAAGLGARPSTIILSAGLLGLAGLLLGNLQGPLLGTALAAVGVIAPYAYLRWRKRQRLESFESQLPDSLDLLCNAMRAGYSFQAAMELVGQEMPDPLGGEFEQFYEEQRLGMDVRSALLGLQERVPSMDLKMFITAVLIQRETGGNLTEVLGNISRVIRDRFRVHGELKTLTAQVKLSGKFLAVLPLIVVAAITLLNPEFMEPLFKEKTGHVIIAIAATGQLIGFLLMQKIANIEF